MCATGGGPVSLYCRRWPLGRGAPCSRFPGTARCRPTWGPHAAVGCLQAVGQASKAQWLPVSAAALRRARPCSCRPSTARSKRTSRHTSRSAEVAGGRPKIFLNCLVKVERWTGQVRSAQPGAQLLALALGPTTAAK